MLFNDYKDLNTQIMLSSSKKAEDQEDQWIVDENSTILTTISVSYTHLDVYKRQAERNSPRQGKSIFRHPKKYSCSGPTEGVTFLDVVFPNNLKRRKDLSLIHISNVGKGNWSKIEVAHKGNSITYGNSY